MAGQPVRASEVASRIDWLALSEESQRAIPEIVLPLALGFSTREVADALGVKLSRVQTRLARLRREIREQLDEADS